MLKFLLFAAILVLVSADRERSPFNKYRRPQRVRHVSPAPEYRLPSNVIPSHYQLDLLLGENVFETNTFSGVSSINISVTEPLTTFKFHAKNMDIIIVDLRSETIVFDLLWAGIDADTDTVTVVTVTSELVPNITYLLTITYNGILGLTDMTGFYRSTYTESGTGIVHYLASTDFEATNARKAFPCFDEPAFKATFDISLTFPQTHNARGNTRIASSGPISGTNLTQVVFEVTPVMSTYLVAFVISEFTCTEGEPSDTSPTEVCSNPETAAARATAVSAAPRVLQVMENYTGVTYSWSGIGKLTQAAIPDYDSGAMENWGMIIYRETMLLWDSEESSNRYQQDVVTIVAHELSHQWFGNLVTLDWWTNVFLNEGFATYFEYFAPDEFYPEWELPQQFVVEQLQGALDADSYEWSVPLSYYVETPDDISNRFDSISYSKGGSILRMVRYFLGIDNFKFGLTDYIAANNFSLSTPSLLWSSFEQYAQQLPEPQTLPTTMLDVMSNWTYEAGYPLLTVTSDGDNVIISQEQFLISGTSDTQWYVPVTYTLSNEDTSETTTRAWLVPGTNLTLEGVLANSSWILLNNDQIGYYRVDYDTLLWERLSQALSAPDFDGINVLNRAQIADDVFNFARAGKITFSDVLELLSFLRNETEYYPWDASVYIFNYLLRRIGDAELTDALRNYISELITQLYASTPFDLEQSADQIYTFKKNLALSWACSLNLGDCAAKSVESLTNYRDTGLRPSRNLRDVIYCNGVRYSENASADFDFLWQRYLETRVSSEQETILYALGCSQDENILIRYLENTISEDGGIRRQDVWIVYSAVYSRGIQGVNAAFDFVTTQYQQFVTYFAGNDDLNYLIYVVSNRFTSQEQIDRLRRFIETPGLDEDIRLNALDSLANAEANLELIQVLENDIRTYLLSKY